MVVGDATVVSEHRARDTPDDRERDREHRADDEQEHHRSEEPIRQHEEHADGMLEHADHRARRRAVTDPQRSVDAFDREELHAERREQLGLDGRRRDRLSVLSRRGASGRTAIRPPPESTTSTGATAPDPCGEARPADQPQARGVGELRARAAPVFHDPAPHRDRTDHAGAGVEHARTGERLGCGGRVQPARASLARRTMP